MQPLSNQQLAIKANEARILRLTMSFRPAGFAPADGTFRGWENRDVSRPVPGVSRKSLPVEYARGLAGGLRHLPLCVSDAEHADQPECLRHAVAGLDFRSVHEGLGECQWDAVLP